MSPLLKLQTGAPDGVSTPTGVGALVGLPTIKPQNLGRAVSPRTPELNTQNRLTGRADRPWSADPNHTTQKHPCPPARPGLRSKLLREAGYELSRVSVLSGLSVMNLNRNKKGPRIRVTPFLKYIF